MSWIEKLYKTYENNTVSIGKGEISLLPLCHTTQNAQVTIVIDGDGNFIRAFVVPKSDSRTIIPATEESAGRTSGIVAHPLCDKLQYVAADYGCFVGDKDSGEDTLVALIDKWTKKKMMASQRKIFLEFEKSHTKQLLIELLREWIRKNDKHDQLGAIKAYCEFEGAKAIGHASYFFRLKEWSELSGNLKLKAICRYVEKGHVMQDLTQVRQLRG